MSPSLSLRLSVVLALAAGVKVLITPGGNQLVRTLRTDRKVGASSAPAHHRRPAPPNWAQRALHDDGKANGALERIAGILDTTLVELTVRRKDDPPPPDPVDCMGEWHAITECKPCGDIKYEFRVSRPAKHGGKNCVWEWPPKSKEYHELHHMAQDTIKCDCDCDGYFEQGICKDCSERLDIWRETRAVQAKGKPCEYQNGQEVINECHCGPCVGEFKPVRNVDCVDCGTEYEYRVSQKRTGEGEDCPHADGYRKTDCNGKWQDEMAGFRCKDENNCKTESVGFNVINDETGGGSCQQRGQKREAICSTENNSCDQDCKGSWQYEESCNNECDKRVYKMFVETVAQQGRGKKCEARQGARMKERCTCTVDCYGEWEMQSECNCAAGTTTMREKFTIKTKKQGADSLQCEHKEGESRETDCECPATAPPTMMNGAKTQTALVAAAAAALATCA